MKIDEIKYQDTLKCFCTISGGLYTNNLTIKFVPNKMLPDYIKLHDDIQKLQLHSLIIEEAVDKVLDIVLKYDPLYAQVESFVADASHPTVTITKKHWRIVDEEKPNFETEG